MTLPVQLLKIAFNNVSAVKLYQLMLIPCAGRLQAELIQADTEIQVRHSWQRLPQSQILPWHFWGCWALLQSNMAFQPCPAGNSAGSPTLHLGEDAQPVLSTKEFKHQKLAPIINKPPRAEPKEAATPSSNAESHCCSKGWVCSLLWAW